MIRKIKTIGSSITWTKKLLAAGLIAGAALTPLQSAMAALKYWDINGATTGSGQTGTAPFRFWGTAATNSFWSTDPNGEVATGPWVAGDIAVFSAGIDATANFSVTNAGNINVGGITIEEGGNVTIRSATTTLSGTAILDVPTGSTLTVSSVLAGAVGMKKTGDGDLFVGGGNSYTGKTIIGGGRARTTGASLTGLGAVPGGFAADHLTLTNGGTVVINDNNASPTFSWHANIGLTVGAGGGTIQVFGTGSVITGTGVKFTGGVGSVLTKTGTNEFRWGNTATTSTNNVEKLVVKEGRWVAGSGGSLGQDYHFGAVLGSYMADQITLDGPTGRLDFNGGTAATLITLNANRGITVTANGGGFENEGSSARILGKITGPGQISRWGAHGLFLAGDNDFAGGFRFMPASGVGRTLAGAGTGVVLLEHSNALGTGTLQFDVAGTIVPQVPGLVIPNDHFWNSLNQSYGSVSSSLGGIPVVNNSATYTGDVNTGSSGSAPTVTFNGSAAVSSFTGVIGNSLGFTKAGLGTMAISGNNTYGNASAANGQTTVNAGTLLVNNTVGSGTGASDVTVASGATLGGSGTISGVVTNNGTIAPGNASVGTLTTGNALMNELSTLRVDINNATGGDGIGHDLLNVNGTLALNATLANPMTIRVISLNGSVAGQAANFSSSNPGGYSWKIATASGGITGFDANNITIISGAFSNPVNGGSFSVSQVGNDLFLVFRNPAQIVADPANQASAPTGSASFSVTATGEDTIAYQWQISTDAGANYSNLANGTAAGGTIISGADAATLNISNIQVADMPTGSLFKALVSNTAGNDESAAASLSLTDPAISSSPANLTIGAGSNAVFTVVAQGSPTLNYAWSKDGLPIDNLDPHYSGVNSATLTVIGVTDADEGGYEVEVSNSGAQSPQLSATATLDVINPPAITVQPVDTTVTAGTTANFSVTATGDSLAYQWRKNGVNIGGKTTSALSLTSVTLADAADYDVVITNFANTVTSDAATLTVQFTLTANSASAFGSVSKSPDESLYDANESVELTASSSNPNILFSHWTGSATGSDNPLNVIMDANKTITANYTSAVPDVVVEENNADNANGSITTFYGSGWSHGLGGAATFSFANPVYDQLGTPTATAKMAPNVVTAGNYDVYARWTASAPGGNRGTNVPLRVFHSGGTAETRVNQEANGLTYMLIASGKYFQAGTNSYIEVGNDVTLGAGGDICVADSVKLVFSQSVQQNPVVFTTQPASQTVGKGSNVVFTVATTGDGPITYQWQKDGVDISGETTDTLSITAIEQATYRVVADSPTGKHNSANAVLTIDPYITVQPVSTTGATASTVQFSVTATGTGPISYVWKKDGSPLSNVGVVSGADTDTLTLTGVSIADEGDYSVAISNANGNDESVEASFTILDAPVIVTPPASVTKNQGQSHTFTVTATGTAPLAYQWNFESAPIANATDSSYTIASVQLADAGEYSVTVTNDAGSVTSADATLTVIADSLAPVVKTVAPKANGIYNNASLLISGTSLDVVGVANVEYDLNSAGFTAADVSFFANGKASNWSKTVTLSPGTNTLVVRSADLANNVTTLPEIKFFYHTASMLVIQTNLNGTVITTNGVGAVLNTISSALFDGNNTNLYVGRTYTLKALETGAPKYILTNWTATWTGQASPVVLQTNNLACTFEMKEGMVLSANYIDNPFYRFGGVYSGLFSATPVAFESAGFVSMKVTPKMTYSAKLIVDGNAISISGKLKIDGTATGVSKARFKTDKPELTLNLAMDFAGGTDSLSGTVVQPTGSTNWTANLLAYRAPWTTNVADLPLTFTNSYTMLIPGFDTVAEGPAGSGSAAFKVDIKGKAKTAGVAADMQPLKQVVLLSGEGHWPFFAPMYKSKRTNALLKPVSETEGFVMGWLQVTNDGASGPMSPVGQLHWIKSGWTNSTYAAGFTNDAKSVTGAVWSFDVLNPSATLPGMTQVQFDFLDGDLSSPFNAIWDVTVKSTFAAVKTNTYPNFVKAGIVAKTGLVKGQFEHPLTPEVLGKVAPTKFQGVMLQPTQTGAGTFVGPSNGGKVTVAAPTP